MENNQIIVVEQKPIIRYELLNKISLEVKEKIDALNLDDLEASEETLTTIKNVRADLNKDFKTLEEQRKLVKEIVLSDYNKFEDDYKRLVSSQFTAADTKLKGLVASVDDEILARKVEGIKDYFISQNKHDFITFENVGLHIIKSNSDKKYQDEIDEFFAKVDNDLKTIETLPNEQRTLAKYQIVKDLNRAIAEVNQEIVREDAIRAKQKEADEARQKEVAEVKKPETVQPEIAQPKPVENKVYTTTFTVHGTIDELKKLKKFLENERIKYERA
jgi:hypothetical protein